MRKCPALLRRALPLAALALMPQAALAWGWWYAGAIVTGAAVCVLTGGIGTPVVAGMAVGSIGTAAPGLEETAFYDSVYDDIVASPNNPVGGALIHQKPNPQAVALPPIQDAQTPQAVLDDLNAARQGFADATVHARGIREACRRFFGAQQAGDPQAMQLQAGYVTEFLQLEQAASAQAVAAYRSYNQALRQLRPPEPDMLTTAAEYKAFRDDVAANGLPQCIVQELDLLLVTASEQAAIEGWLAARSDQEIDQFFGQFPPEGAYAPDLNDMAADAWELQPFEGAIPDAVLAMGVITFCEAKEGLVCGTPSISASGVSSAAAGSGFEVRAGPARHNKSGILLYNKQGTAAIAFEGGKLCVSPQGLRRAGTTNSGAGCFPSSCSGEFKIDMNEFAAGAWVVPDCDGDPSGIAALNPAAYLSVPGTDVYCQMWGRDSVATGSFLSDGLYYVVGG